MRKDLRKCNESRFYQVLKPEHMTKLEVSTYDVNP